MALEDENVPPNRVTRDNIGEHAAALRALFPEEIFAQLTRGYADLATAKSLPEYFERLARAHPFAVAWHQLQQSVEARSIQLSEQAFFLLDMRFPILVAAQDPEFAELLNKLKGDDEFFSAAFEAFIFYMYAHEFKLPIAFVQPTRGEQPDFVSDFGDAGKVYIECKSLLDDVRIEDRVWDTIRQAIIRRLDKQKKSLEVVIEAKRPILSKDAADVVAEINGIIRNYEGDIRLEGSAYVANIQTIMNDSEVMPLPLHFDIGADYQMVFGAEHTSVEASKVWVLKTRAFPGSSQLDRLRALFTKARDQLPSDSPGVVHFQIPYRNPRHFQKALDDCQDELARDLNRRKHICAIVITGRFQDKNLQNGGDPIISFHAVIPNYAATQTLPADFVILGSHPMTLPGGEIIGEFELPSIGVIFIQFGIFREMLEQSGRYLLQYCSHNGRRQLNLWQDFSGRSRLELWHEESGHHVLDFDMNGIVPGKTNKAAIRWSAGGLSVSLNGAIVGNSVVDVTTQ
ncbi:MULTISPECIES: hypothetical protein [unclassified Mesorhizobium]|uniref:hypothetical protein n=1 Tax=unclassified Mesorhizobium TaxID=325217 RepID=UPI000BB0A8E1|nr:MULTISPECIES: hypothetical protein [unclassified Mesorhizobium]PBB26130.1 hypothetical protein CK232_13365 [Mesorhizobium sp. WSM4304]PBB75783.1 hypothetical protein CK227_09290 [Mesorhizobium sp. WSM4308]